MIQDILKAVYISVSLTTASFAIMAVIYAIVYILSGGLSAVQVPTACLLPPLTPVKEVEPHVEESLGALPVGECCLAALEELNSFSCVDFFGRVWLRNDYWCSGKTEKLWWAQSPDLVVVSHDANGYHIRSAGHLQWRKDRCMRMFGIPVASVSCKESVRAD